VIQETAHASLGAWESFYVIVGSSAAALTGLQFVVMTLVSEIMSDRTSGTEIDAFGSPTVVHFCAALLVSATLSAPWPGLLGAAVVIGACGIVGLAYTAIVVRRARRQTGYTMVAEDWIWHIILPPIAYGAQVISAFVLETATLLALFAIAGSSLLLVFIGIHNAWDTTTFMTAKRLAAAKAARSRALEPTEPPQPARLPQPPQPPQPPQAPAPAAAIGDGNR
jgi:hypothetical protein